MKSLRIKAHMLSFLWSVAEFAIYPLLLLIATPLYIRSLGLQGYGQWLLAAGVIGLAGVAGLGAGAATVRYVSEARGRGDRAAAQAVLGQALMIAAAGGLLIGFAVVIAAPWAARNLFAQMGDPQTVATALAIGGAVLMLQQPDAVFAATIKACERFAVAARVELAARVLQVAASAGTAAATGDVAASLLALLGSGVAVTVLRAVVACRVSGLSIEWSAWRARDARRVLAFGAWGWLQGVGAALFQFLDRFVIGALLGAAALAQFAVCSQLAILVHALPAAGFAFLFPLVSRRLASEGIAALAPLRRRAILANLALAAALALPLLIWGGDLLALWIDARFAAENAWLLGWLVIAYFVLALGVAPHYLLLGQGEARFVSLLNFAGGLASTAAAVALVPLAGVLGGAYARCLYGPAIALNYVRLLRPRAV